MHNYLNLVKYYSLASLLRSKDLRWVLRGGVGKVPTKATRWRLTLPQVLVLRGLSGSNVARLLGQRDGNVPNLPGCQISIRISKYSSLCIIRFVILISN